MAALRTAASAEQLRERVADVQFVVDELDAPRRAPRARLGAGPPGCAGRLGPFLRRAHRAGPGRPALPGACRARRRSALQGLHRLQPVAGAGGQCLRRGDATLPGHHRLRRQRPAAPIAERRRPCARIRRPASRPARVVVAGWRRSHDLQWQRRAPTARAVRAAQAQRGRRRRASRAITRSSPRSPRCGGARTCSATRRRWPHCDRRRAWPRAIAGVSTELSSPSAPGDPHVPHRHRRQPAQARLAGRDAQALAAVARPGRRAGRRPSATPRCCGSRRRKTPAWTSIGDGEQSRQHFVHGFLEQVEGIDFEHKVEMGIRDDRYKAMVPQVVAPLALKGRVHATEAQLAARAHHGARSSSRCPGR